jgi:hypothetical protein
MLKIAQPRVIVSLLNDTVKPTLFLGAGASKQSGIKLVTEIVEEIAKWAYCDQHGLKPDDPRVTLSDWTKWLKEFQWYNENYSDLYPIIIDQLLIPSQKRRDFFLKIITPNIPASRGYEILCELIHMDLIDTILTGKFDNCLTSFSANWSALSGATSYQLDVSTDSNFATFVYNNISIGNVTTYSVTGLVAGTTYYYRVRGLNGSGPSPNSNTITVPTITVAPTLSITNPTVSSFVANWSTANGATSYTLQTALNNSFTSSVITSYSGQSATSFQVTSH